MYRKYLIICLLAINVEVVMGQTTIGLSNLLDFQQQQSPSYIANFLNAAGGWVSNYSDFADARSSYKWYKAGPTEEFEPHTKDEIAYKTVLPSYKSVITYRTLSKSNFDAIKASMQSSMTVGETLINDPRVKMYTYSNASVAIEVVEPLQPQKDNLFIYVFVVYNKQDYDNGFKIR